MTGFRSQLLSNAARSDSEPIIIGRDVKYGWGDLGKAAVEIGSRPDSFVTVIPLTEEPAVAAMLVGASILAGRPFLLTSDKDYESSAALVAASSSGCVKGSDDCVDWYFSRYVGNKFLYYARTSGTICTARYVPIEEAGYSAFAQEGCKVLGLSPGIRFGEVGCLSSDLSITNFLLCLYAGAVIIIFRKLEAQLSPLYLFSRHDIQSSRCVGIHARVMALECCRKNFILHRNLILGFGGSQLDSKAIETILDKYSYVSVVNTYGSTECAGFATSWNANIDKIHKLGSIPLGEVLPLYRMTVSPEGELILFAEHMPRIYLSVTQNEIMVMDIPTVPFFSTGDLVDQRYGELFFRARKGASCNVKGVLGGLTRY